MKTPLTFAGLLLVAGAVPAQDATPPPQDPKARMEALRQEERAFYDAFRAEQMKLTEEAKKNKKPGTPMRAMQMGPDMAPMVAKFAAAAADYAGKDDAVMFLSWIVQNGMGKSRPAAQAAAGTLAEHHAASAEIGQIAAMAEYLPRIIGEESAKRLIDAVKAKNKSPDVLGWFALAELGSTIEKADTDSRAYQAAKKRLQVFLAEATDQRLKNEITGKIALREKLGIGSIAPDIAGVDLDGVEFKLSDYRGKIIFLDFWGDW